MFVIIGTTTADLFIFSKKPFSNLGDDGFQAGNLEFCDDPPLMLMGGNGGCSACVLAGLGMPTALCSAVGRDHSGDRLIGWLEDRDVDLQALCTSNTHATSCSTIILSDAAHQLVFHHLGATREIRPDLISQKLISRTEALLITSYSIIPALRRGRFNSILSAIHAVGGVCALDVGPAIGEPVTLNEIQPLLPNIDYLMANSHELAALTQTTDWEAASRQLLLAGAKCIIVKRGADGASVRGTEIDLNVAGYKVKSSISVGAGDAFNAGFLWGVQQGWPMERSLRFANGLAAIVVSSANGVLDAPTSAQVEAFIA